MSHLKKSKIKEEYYVYLYSNSHRDDDCSKIFKISPRKILNHIDDHEIDGVWFCIERKQENVIDMLENALNSHKEESWSRGKKWGGKIYRIRERGEVVKEIECVRDEKYIPDAETIAAAEKECEERNRQARKRLIEIKEKERINLSDIPLSLNRAALGCPEDKKMIKVLREMRGSKIINTGFVQGIEGGLSFEYETKKGVLKRVVFGYTELGEWVEYNGKKKRV